MPKFSLVDRLEGKTIPGNSLRVDVLPPNLLDGKIWVDRGMRLDKRDGVEVLVVERSIRPVRLEDGEIAISEDMKFSDRDSDELSACLLEFVHLDDGSADEILAFARRWGLMGICRHGKPSGHHPDCRPLQQDKLSEGVRILWEPLEDWRRLAKQVKAILNVIVDMTMSTGGTGNSQDWKTIAECTRPPRAAGFGDASPMKVPDLYGPDERWYLKMLGREISHISALGQYVVNWLLYGGVVLQAFPQEEGDFGLLQLEPWAHNVTGVLALQLARAATSRVGIYRCDDPSCRKPYEPSRTPRANESHYCSTCSGGNKKLAGKRKYWRKTGSEARRASKRSKRVNNGE